MDQQRVAQQRRVAHDEGRGYTSWFPFAGTRFGMPQATKLRNREKK